MAYVFFTSYARMDRNRWMDRFVDNLSEDVGAKMAIARADVCFYDVKSIRTGSQWRDVLSEGLRQSRVLVFFYSPRYVRSTYCGKEFRAFLHRLEAHRGTAVRAIFPVLWELHEPMPAVLTRYQHSDGDGFPEHYAKAGLRELGILKKHRDRFREVALVLSKRIKEALDQGQLPLAADLPSLDELVPVWEWEPFNVSAVYWHPRGGEWKPFSDNEPIVEIVEQVLSNRRLACRELEVTGDLLAKLRRSEQDRDATVVITDLETLRSPRYAALWSAFDQSAPPNCGLLIVRENTELDGEAAVAAVRKILPNRTSTEISRNDELSSITSTAILREKVETMVERLLGVVRSGTQPTRRAESGELERAAESEGISLQALPGLAGPGGKP